MTLTGIAVLPDDDTTDRLIAFQERHRDLIGGPELGRMTNLPHVSILQCPYRPDLPMTQILDELARETKGFADLPLPLVTIRYQPVRWLFLDVERSRWLKHLHTHALRTTEQHIDTALIDRSKDTDGYTDEERANYLRYGYRYVGDTFQPHFTLGRIPPDVFEQANLGGLFASELNGQRSRTPRAARLVVYRAGEHGALVEILAEVPLGP